MELVGTDLLSIPMWVSAGGILGLLLNYILRNKAGDREGWGSLFKGLQERVEALEHECAILRVEVNECRRREGEWMSRAIVAEAKLLGQGEVNQAAAVAQAEVRADPAKAPSSVKRFGDGKGKRDA